MQGAGTIFGKCAYFAAEQVGEHPENEVGQTNMIAWILGFKVVRCSVE